MLFSHFFIADLLLLYHKILAAMKYLLWFYFVTHFNNNEFDPPWCQSLLLMNHFMPPPPRGIFCKCHDLISTEPPSKIAMRGHSQQWSTSQFTKQGNFSPKQNFHHDQYQSQRSKVIVWLKLNLLIKQMAQAMPQPNASSICGDCVRSLCLLTPLPTAEYVVLPKAKNLITAKKKEFGRYIFATSKDIWNDFLLFHGLWEGPNRNRRKQK